MASGRICQIIQSLRDVLSTQKPPYCTGTVQIPQDQYTLYYGPKGNAHRIDLSQATESELVNLSNSCEAATFGVNQKDVLDESYRKARKLDVANFSTNLELHRSDIMRVVRAALLEGHDGNRPVEAELYKLNVYEKGGFFKPHKDTPRSGTMFASLVVVFPTAHEGGLLKLRHGGNEWTVDPASTMAADNTTGPVISYIAFYSDVEHEVTPVTSGHRVTLTWNLYFQPAVVPPDYSPSMPSPLVCPRLSESESAVKAAFTRILSDRDFLPDGGLVGFGLCQEYPLNPDVGLGNLADCLKGCDAIIQSVCHQLSLKTSLRLVYEHKELEDFAMIDHFHTFSPWDSVETLGYELEKGGGMYISKPEPITIEKQNYYAGDEVIWITDLMEYTRTKVTCNVVLGNEPSLGYIYGTVCLIVDMGPVGKRTIGDRRKLY